MNYICINRGRHLFECLVTCLEKHPLHQDKNYWYFSLSLTFFENINQEHMHSLLPHCAFLWTVCLCTVKIYVRCLCLHSYLAMFCLDQWQLEISVELNIFVTGNNSLPHKRSVMVAVNLHLNATYAQHLVLKSVYDDEKRQAKYIMGGKLFSSRRACLN